MIDPNYIVGLVDGEGSFTSYVRDLKRSKEVKRRNRIEPKFYLTLIERDKEILYRLKKYFGCGNVYFQKDSRLNHQNCYRYEVGRREDLNQKIIPFFKKHRLKLKSKSKDFSLFCEIMKMISRGEHLGDEGLEKILKIKQSMH
ncbi:MAG: endonuclease [Candidatus Yanofskybacteria bacterium CG10_big_fil_rev_8_21_14_0_10_46_23]|uniref:Endonuclease n=1 Tax=Candidatus Yanofskybacteria bacterium CG10_big_fil_rev_8_21_14_0_10_46_23 TaxID=1975098 RepID=A0A2H0R3P2_9BACT|nr:MAG: endonuclease [Candidatus Yanofskybacteria bacterium CG10_big_fil_rev_8_21_14_0_10_46_23]